MRRSPSDGNGTGWITKSELLNLQKIGQFVDDRKEIVSQSDDYYNQDGIVSSGHRHTHLLV